MKRQEQIVSILSHYFQVAWNQAGVKWGAENQEEIKELARVIANEPTPLAHGTGVCICDSPPEVKEVWSRRQGFDSWLAEEQKDPKTGLAILDHRCPKHGEQAQPRIWGRHKTMTLLVTAKQWSSLGITYSVEEEPITPVEARMGGPKNG